LPLSKVVVIGSGVLDALGLREAQDVDLVVDQELFSLLRDTGEWQSAIVHGEEALYSEVHDAEVWQSWGSEGAPNFTELMDESIEVGGVHFANPTFVMEWKKQRNRPKDERDVALLEAYLKGNGTA